MLTDSKIARTHLPSSPTPRRTTVCMVSGTRGMTTISIRAMEPSSASSSTACSILPVRRDCIFTVFKFSMPRMSISFGTSPPVAAACFIFDKNSGSFVCIIFISEILRFFNFRMICILDSCCKACFSRCNPGHLEAAPRPAQSLSARHRGSPRKKWRTGAF